LRQSGKIAQFNNQIGLAMSTSGELMFVADTGQNLIRQIYCATGHDSKIDNWRNLF
jgi:sugar lactone lactonase YvrE